MTDQEFLDAFETGRISTAQFHHRDHLRLAWVQVQRLGPEGAAAAVSAGIRRFAGAHGLDRLYHETLTRFWVRIVAHAAAPTFEDTLRLHPLLLDKELPLRHWRRETLFGDAARAGWVEPDLAKLPFP
jgi:hypothetical protein